MRDVVLHKWKLTGIVASIVIVLVMPIYALKEARLRATQPAPVSSEATFVGRDKCIDCHKDAYNAWRGSDHDNAVTVLIARQSAASKARSTPSSRTRSTASRWPAP